MTYDEQLTTEPAEERCGECDRPLSRCLCQERDDGLSADPLSPQQRDDYEATRHLFR